MDAVVPVNSDMSENPEAAEVPEVLDTDREPIAAMSLGIGAADRGKDEVEGDFGVPKPRILDLRAGRTVRFTSISLNSPVLESLLDWRDIVLDKMPCSESA